MRLVGTFIILIITLLCFCFQLGKNDIVTSQSFLIPAGDVLSNANSELQETQLFDKQIEGFMQQWNIRGASFALMKDGQLLYSKGYGYADAEEQIPTEVRHIFRIASISKLITATGIMKLVEDNQLHLNDTVFGAHGILNDSIYSNFVDNRFTHITVENLLRHQGGFSNGAGDPMFNSITVAETMNVEAPADLQTIVLYTLQRKLRNEPGTRTRYSNVGYGILSLIIEKISGISYYDFIQKRILMPAGCFNFQLGKNLYEDKFQEEVKYYDTAGDSLVMSCDGSGNLVPKYYGGNNIEALVGAGGWVASPTELLRFLSVIDGDPCVPDILSAESIKKMTEYDESRLPIGWMHTNQNGEWIRSGTLCGTSALMKREADGTAWVFITNTSSWKGSKFPRYINTAITSALNSLESLPNQNLFSLQESSSFSNDEI